jgi:hypothetical protein
MIFKSIETANLVMIVVKAKIVIFPPSGIC